MLPGDNLNKSSLFERLPKEILTEPDADSLLGLVLRRIKKLLDADRATFYFFSQESGELASFAATELEIKEIRLGLGKGIAGRAALEGKALNIKDAGSCKFFDKSFDRKTGYRTKSVLCCPLFDKKRKLLGVLEVFNKKYGYFTNADEEMLKSISFYLAVSLENIRLAQESESLLRSTLYALAGAIDAKDPVTAGHSYRVAYLSVRLAKAMGFQEEDVRILEYSAYLHDVGKIGIPDGLLSKPGKLKPRELAAMRRHPIHTLQILKNIVFSRETRQIPFIASSHHEFLDGSGYPFGFKKDRISVFSRIITLADIYDALVSFDRPYKKSFGPEEALKILDQEAKKGHLDSGIVKIFISKELYKYERRKYERMDKESFVSYQIIPQARIFKQESLLKKKVTSYDLDILADERKKSLVISRKGVLFLTKVYLPVGVYLDLEVGVGPALVKCIGKVVWAERVLATPFYRVGASFVDISSQMKKSLSKILLSRK